MNNFGFWNMGPALATPGPPPISSPTYGRMLASRDYGFDSAASSTDVNWTNDGVSVHSFVDAATSPTLGITVVLRNSNISYSSDASTFTASTNAGGGHSAIIWSDYLSMFIANNNTSGYGIVTSTDGINWTERVCAYSPMSIASSNNLLVGCLSGITVVSSDGISWSDYAITGDWVCIDCSSTGLFLMCAMWGTYNGQSVTSTDGISWDSPVTIIPSGYAIYDVAYSPTLNLFCTVGETYAPYYSTDGTSWTQSDAGGGVTRQTIKWLAGVNGVGAFVIVGSNRYAKSVNGINYTNQGYFDNNSHNGLAYFPGIL